MLAQALADQGWSVWWDQSIPPGKTWAEVIGKQLTTARCVLALWSKISVTKRWVLKEARFADQQGTLIPVGIEDVEPPFKFGDIQAADLTDWRGNLSHPGYKLLLEVVSDVLGVSPTVATEAPHATAAKRLAHLEPSISPHHPVEPAEAGKRAPAERSKDKAPTEGQRTSASTPHFHQKHRVALIGAVALVAATGVIAWQQLGKESPSTASSPLTIVGDTPKPSVAPPSSELTVEPDKPGSQGQMQSVTPALTKGTTLGAAPTAPTAPAEPTPSEIAQAQKLLAQLGYNPGAADGSLGRRTRVAVEAYQRRAGLPVDGAITPDLLASLLRTAPAPQPSATKPPP